jgi:hypothetical protein
MCPAVEMPPAIEGPPGVPLEIAPPAPAVPLPGREASSRPPTIQEFAAGFHPSAGNHEVVVLHPYTNSPVKVSFALPPGSPQVKVGGILRRCVEFKYGKHHTEIWFYRNGQVKVKS